MLDYDIAKKNLTASQANYLEEYQKKIQCEGTFSEKTGLNSYFLDLTKDLPSSPTENYYYQYNKKKRVKKDIFNTQDASTITDTQQSKSP